MLRPNLYAIKYLRALILHKSPGRLSSKLELIDHVISGLSYNH